MYSAVWPEWSLGQGTHIFTCNTSNTYPKHWMWTEKYLKEEPKKYNSSLKTDGPTIMNSTVGIYEEYCLSKYSILHKSIRRLYEWSGCPYWPLSPSLSCLVSGPRPLMTSPVTSQQGYSGAPASRGFWLTPEAASRGWMTLLGSSPGPCAQAAGNLMSGSRN